MWVARSRRRFRFGRSINDWLVYLGERGELISIGNYYGMKLQCIIHNTYGQVDIGGLASFAITTALAISSSDRKDWIG